MDYNELNNFLLNLQVKEEEINNTYDNKINNDFNQTYNSTNNELYFKDNKMKNVTLERDLRLNNNINYSREIANPQRFNQTNLKKDTKESNSKINNYNFNNYSTIFRNNNNLDISQNFNMNTKNVIKNDINDKLSSRDRIPNNSVFEFK